MHADDVGSSPDALETVRLDRGLTQVQLAQCSGVSQAALSKAESGLAPLTGERLSRVAEALECPVELLTSRPAAAASACVFHRKRASTTVGQARQARSRLALARVHAEALLELVEAEPAALPRSTPTEDDYISPEDVAREVRAALGVPPGPVRDLVGALERAGVVVMAVDLGGPRMDALSDWVAGRRPVLLMNRHARGERQRFTLAHETGHVVMHTVPLPEAEAQADRFAAELLMPAADIRAELVGLTLDRAVAMKARWGVSAAALLRRANDLGQLTDHAYRRGMTELSAAGWRKDEPAPVPAESPGSLANALSMARSRFDDAEIARRVFVLKHQLDEVFDPVGVAA